MDINQIKLIVLLILSLLIVILFFIWTIGRELSKRLKPLAQSLGGEIVRTYGDAFLAINWKGIPVKIKIHPASQYNPQTLYIYIEAPFRVKFTIKRKSRIYTFFNKKCLKTYDPEFDKKYIITSPDPVAIAPQFQNNSVREAIDFLFTQGFTSIHYNGKEIILTKFGYTDTDLSPEKITEFIERAIALL